MSLHGDGERERERQDCMRGKGTRHYLVLVLVQLQACCARNVCGKSKVCVMIWRLTALGDLRKIGEVEAFLQASSTRTGTLMKAHQEQKR
jgi:hypothetical protein